MWLKRFVSRIISWLCDLLSGNGCFSHIHKVAAEFHRHFLPQTKVRPPLKIMRLIATKAASIWRSHLALIVCCLQFGSRRISRSQPNMKQAFTRVFSRHTLVMGAAWALPVGHFIRVIFLYYPNI
ncbi:hypothetical protein EDD85DRAFT_449945 [Armillaria nabsnona]|nr:hypothetical protein EDD85DRAFT_449945 [Armillaria nabsnona]